MKSLARFFVVFAALAAAPALAHESVGKITFPTSCDTRVQPDFERGVAMLHSYWFSAARKVFHSVVERDPACAMAYWGLAMVSLGNTLSAPPPAKEALAAWDALEKARAIPPKTARERDWIDALSEYYRDHDKVALEIRLNAYAAAMERITQRYPDDFEARVIYALLLQSTASHADRTYAAQLKSAAILEKLFAQDPQHPGVAHYLVHAYDYPPFAQKGIPIARRYERIAPAAPHALHMPSHIYSMVGMWEESIASNQASLDAEPVGYHQMDFMVYAYLQLAQDAKAAAMSDKAQAMFRAGRIAGGSTLGRFTAVAAMPARVALERADWKAAGALPVTQTPHAAADSITRFARGLGLARSGDVAGAKREVEELNALRAALQKSSQAYWADRTNEQILAVNAWIAHREGRPEALKLMRAAADSEDASVKHVAMENRLYPFRELLADMLLEAKQARAALHEYEAALKENPNRYRGLYGAATAAEAVGDRRKAADYFGKVLALAKDADSARPELTRAKAYLAQR